MAYSVWQTCMLIPGLSRSECASWVQAWGSIIAIAGAFAIAYFQARHQRAVEKQRQADNLRERCLTAAELVRNFKAFADLLAKRMESRDRGVALDIAQNFKHAVPVFCSIPSMDLPSQLASRVAGLQYAAMMILTRINAGDSEGLVRMLRQLSADCEEAVARAHELAVHLAAGASITPRIKVVHHQSETPVTE